MRRLGRSPSANSRRARGRLFGCVTRKVPRPIRLRSGQDENLGGCETKAVELRCWSASELRRGVWYPLKTFGPRRIFEVNINGSDRFVSSAS